MSTVGTSAKPRSSVERKRETTSSISRISFFFNDTATTEIYTLSLHDALPILLVSAAALLLGLFVAVPLGAVFATALRAGDRKSTRLNSSHSQISYAVFCLKKKKSKAAHLR